MIKVTDNSYGIKNTGGKKIFGREKVRMFITVGKILG